MEEYNQIIEYVEHLKYNSIYKITLHDKVLQYIFLTTEQRDYLKQELVSHTFYDLLRRGPFVEDDRDFDSIWNTIFQPLWDNLGAYMYDADYQDYQNDSEVSHRDDEWDISPIESYTIEELQAIKIHLDEPLFGIRGTIYLITNDMQIEEYGNVPIPITKEEYAQILYAFVRSYGNFTFQEIKNHNYITDELCLKIEKEVGIGVTARGISKYYFELSSIIDNVYDLIGGGAYAREKVNQDLRMYFECLDWKIEIKVEFENHTIIHYHDIDAKKSMSVLGIKSYKELIEKWNELFFAKWNGKILGLEDWLITNNISYNKERLFIDIK